MSPVVQSIDDAEDFASVRQAMTLLGESHTDTLTTIHIHE